MSSDPAARPPLPPFTPETATTKVRRAEDAWNSHDPHRRPDDHPGLSALGL